MTEYFSPLGPRIKVEVKGEGEKKSSGGIILDGGTRDEESELGTVIELGKYAYGNFEENWAEIGDTVLFQRYAGKPKEETLPSGKVRFFRILKDVDVIAVVKKEENQEVTNG